MYGYVQICKPELKFREFDVYRSFYCGLCHTLKVRFGSLARLVTLSYDMTFLVLLLDSLYEPEGTAFDHRCVAHPIHRQHFYCSSITEYAADMSLLLTVQKLHDDWIDEKKQLRHLLEHMLSGKSRAVREHYQQKAAAMEQQLDRLHHLEQQNCTQPELPAACFGNILAELFDYRQDCWSPHLRDIGFYLGKFIYLSDAYDDLAKDRKKHTYNPFLAAADDDPAFHQQCEALLRIAIAPAAAALEYLPLVRNVEILRNILYAGVWSAFYQKQRAALQDLPAAPGKEATTYDT